jgi:twitching motility protein PilT
MAQIDRFIEAAFRRGGERIIIAAGERAHFYSEGTSQGMTNVPASAGQARALLLAVLPSELHSTLVSGEPFEFGHMSPEGEVSIKVSHTPLGIHCEILRGSSGESASLAATERIASPADAHGTSEPSPAPARYGAVAVAEAPDSDGTQDRRSVSSPEPSRSDAAPSRPGAIPVSLGASTDFTAAGSATIPAGAGRTAGESAVIGPSSHPVESGELVTTAVEPRGGTLQAAMAECRIRMEGLLRRMVQEGCSDLHLCSRTVPYFRKDGDIVAIGGLSEHSAAQVRELLMSIAPKRYQEQFEGSGDADFAYEIEGVSRYRCNIFMDRLGPGGVFRAIPSKIPSAEDLGLPRAILSLCDYSQGLVLVTGPTGSGKSTTLAAMIDRINATRKAHIITIEDPIEFVHANKMCLVNQREVGVHTEGFKSALRAALREDPDIVLVGEMRDLETVAIAIETAETGHLVFGTLHTNTAPSTVDRIIDQFPADRQGQVRTMLSESLRGVISQTLCKKKGGGRAAALEILLVTAAISNLIREGKAFQIPSLMQTGKGLGMMLMNDSLLTLVQKGLIEPTEALDRSLAKSELKQAMERAGSHSA